MYEDEDGQPVRASKGFVDKYRLVTNTRRIQYGLANQSLQGLMHSPFQEVLL